MVVPVDDYPLILAEHGLLGRASAHKKENVVKTMAYPSPLIRSLEERFLRPEGLPDFRVGDTVKVQVRIREGDKGERLQAFEGVVIGKNMEGSRSTFTVRKVSYGVGVERVFPMHSPNVASLEVVSPGKVRQAKLYFLRDLRGKAARIKERAVERSQGEKKAGRKKRGAHRKATSAAAPEEVAAPKEVKAKDKRKSRKEAKAKKKAQKASEAVAKKSEGAAEAPAAEAPAEKAAE